MLNKAVLSSALAASLAFAAPAPQGQNFGQYGPGRANGGNSYGPGAFGNIASQLSQAFQSYSAAASQVASSVVATSVVASASSASAVVASSASQAASQVSAAPLSAQESYQVIGDVPGYTGADGPFSETPAPLTTIPSAPYGPDSQVAAIPTAAPTGTESGAAPPRVSSDVTGATSHGPYSGVPTTTGAVMNNPINATIPALPPNPTATYYNADGTLLNREPIPYTPAGKSYSQVFSF